jgi:hypothetical protein
MHPISRTPAVHAVRRRAARWPQGKTCVIAALVLSNPAANLKPVSDAAFKLLTSPDGATHKYKVTVIVVNNTLVEQASSLGSATPHRCVDARDPMPVLSSAVCAVGRRAEEVRAGPQRVHLLR